MLVVVAFSSSFYNGVKFDLNNIIGFWSCWPKYLDFLFSAWILISSCKDLASFIAVICIELTDRKRT